MSAEKLAKALAGESIEGEDEPIEGEDESIEVEGEPIEGEGEPIEGEGEDEESNLSWGKALGLDDEAVVLDDDGNLKGIKTKIDGKIEEVPVKDLVAGYQTNKSNTQKAQALAEERRGFEAQVGAVIQDYTARLDNFTKLTQVLQAKAIEDSQQINWDQLRAQNPGEYAAKQQEFQMRQQELQGFFSLLQQERVQVMQQQQQYLQQQRAQFIQNETTKILDHMDGWKNPDGTINKEKAANDYMVLKTFAGSEYGYAPEEVDTLDDPRALRVLQDAMKYRQAKNIRKDQQPATPNKPTFQKPGARGKSGKQATQLQRLTQRAKQTQGPAKRGAEADAVAAILLGGLK